MLVGNSDSRGRFVPNDSMVENLVFMMDVTQASASVEADRVRILEEIEGEKGVGAGALNRMAIGACNCAVYAMPQPAVLRAAFGDTSLLDQLQGEQALGEALLGAAAGGFVEQVHVLLDRMGTKGLQFTTSDDRTPLLLACQAGHTEVSWPTVQPQHEHLSSRS